SHSAAFSSYAPPLALVAAIVPAKWAANSTKLRKENIRGCLVSPPSRLLDDPYAFHDHVGCERRQHHQQCGPQEAAFDIGQRQSLGVHAENAGHQRRWQQHRGHDRESVEMAVALLLHLEVKLFFQEAAAFAQFDDIVIETIEP